MKNNGVPIVKEGLPFLFVSLGAVIAFGVAQFWLLSLFFLALTLFIAFFFRNPERLAPVGAQLVCSPADGKVIVVGKVQENEFLKEERIKVSIFMSLFDVHVNRVPIDAKLINRKHHRGQFFAANEDRASEENERNCMLLETESGLKLVLVQVAGLVARRIVCYPVIGSFLLKGQRLGLIRFGSRCDLYFPLDTKILVKVGDKVLGGETLIAELKG